jgi:hypothetical protein
MEINPSSTEPFRWVVVRSTPVPIVVNLLMLTGKNTADREVQHHAG